MSKGKEVKREKKRADKQVVGKRYSSDALCPVWLFTKIDRDGDFAFDVRRPDFCHLDFLAKMIDYSNMTWAQIKTQTHDDGRSKHHDISFELMSKAAQERFKAKKLDGDSDCLFSFALNNLLRIVGLREDEKFYVLWYDPSHGICPSLKKHT